MTPSYEDKIREELSVYKDNVTIHELPEIFHYWSNKYLLPLLKEAGFNTITEIFSVSFLEAQKRIGCEKAFFLSIGSGNGDLEIEVAKNLLTYGLNNFTIECLEINPDMIKRGEENAKEHGVSNHIVFTCTDFNYWTAEKTYHGVMANQALHHVVALEHLFDQLKDNLHNHGTFAISDMIGRNGHQRWPETLQIINNYWKELPDKYRYNLPDNKIYSEYPNVDYSAVGFEGVRSQDILPLLLERFTCEKFIGFGGVIDIFVDRSFGHNFKPEEDWDRNFIDHVHAEGEKGLISGLLTPTQMFAVFTKELTVPPFYSRNINPKTAVRNPLSSD